VKLSLDRDRVTLSVTSPENGTAAEEVPGNYSAEGIEIGFNARYLLDILGRSKATRWKCTSPTPPPPPCCARMTRRRRSMC
jgi:DNA polymerase III sliding clamp (beta) subunit (PCNA family)